MKTLTFFLINLDKGHFKIDTNTLSVILNSFTNILFIGQFLKVAKCVLSFQSNFFLNLISDICDVCSTSLHNPYKIVTSEFPTAQSNASDRFLEGHSEPPSLCFYCYSGFKSLFFWIRHMISLSQNSHESLSMSVIIQMKASL